MRTVSAGRVFGLVVAAGMLLAGGFLALAGMGAFGTRSSEAYAVGGAVLAGLGVSMAYTVLKAPPGHQGPEGRYR